MWPKRCYVWFRGAFRSSWLLLGAMLLFLAFFEGLAFLLLRTVAKGPPVLNPRFCAAADTYAGASWARPLLEETFHLVRNRWEPFVYWEHQPRDGPHVHIDRGGRRRTAPVEAAPAARDTIRILLFGGSTMFGWGARDDYTIASWIARALRPDSAAAITVTNCAQIGYVTNQEVIALETELRRGLRPQIVVFYDGANDIETALLHGRAGITHEEPRLQRFVRSRKRVMIAEAAMKTSLCRLFRRLSGAGCREFRARLTGTDVDRLAQDVFENYREGIRHVRRLGAVYGFDALFYWQPTLYLKLRRTPFEQSILQRRWNPELPPFSDSIYAGLWISTSEKIAEAGDFCPGFRDLSRVFEDDPLPRFVDDQHVGETGNEIIARRMLEDLQPIVRRLAAGM